MIQPETWEAWHLLLKEVDLIPWEEICLCVVFFFLNYPLPPKLLRAPNLCETKLYLRTLMDKSQVTEQTHRTAQTHTRTTECCGSGGVPIITQLNTECCENFLLSPTTTPPMALFYWIILYLVSQTPGPELVLPHCTYVLSQAISVFPRSVSTVF